MSDLRRAAARIRRDVEGASLVLVSVAMLLVLIACASLAVDTAHWFIHKRHLQTQADAGALAAAQNFQFPCGATVNDPPDAQIVATAHKYDGTGTGAYNAQVSSSASPGPTPAGSYNSTNHNIFSLVNASNYINQSTPGDTDLTGDPCQDKAVDLKLSETNLPWFFRIAGVDYINAQARVGILNQDTGGGGLPIAVATPTPKNITATFVDESNGSVLKTVPLSTSDNITWSNGTPASVTVPSGTSSRVGVIVALGGSSSTTCGQSGVQCFDANGASQPATPSSGVVFLHTWSGDGSPGVVTAPATVPDPPQIRDVTLTPAGAAACGDGYFNSSATACTIQLNATMAFGSGVTCNGATPQASLILSGGSTVTMNCPAGGSATGVWTSNPITVPANAGAIAYSLVWHLKTGLQPSGASGGSGSPKTCSTSNICIPTSGPVVVQRTFSGAPDLASAQGSDSGQIQYASVSETGTAADNSVRRCSAATGYVYATCTHTYTVSVTVYGFQNAGTIGSKPVLLRLLGSQGNGAIDCGQGNGSSAFTATMKSGCPQVYGTTQADPSVCTPASTPPLCVSPNPGNGKKVEPGLDDRINGGNGNTCTHRNYWVSPNTIPQIISASPPDPRLVKIMVVPSGSFDGVTGSSGLIPVRTLANFYITDWNSSPCTSAGTDSNGVPYTYDHTAGNAVAQGTVAGYFVKYVTPGSTGTGSGQCDPTSLGGCIAVLTK